MPRATTAVIVLRRVGWGGFIRNKLTRLRLAWTRWYEEPGPRHGRREPLVRAVVCVRPGGLRYLFPLRRLAHEIDHVHTQRGNSMHHAWWHFCTSCGHAFRLFRGDVPRWITHAARILLEDERVVIPLAPDEVWDASDLEELQHVRP